MTERRPRRLRPGDWLALALVAEALALDVLLVTRRHDTISTCVRRSLVARIVAASLCAHLVATLPRDPLTLAGDRLTARYMLSR